MIGVHLCVLFMCFILVESVEIYSEWMDFLFKMSLGPVVYTVAKLGVSEHEVTGMTWGPNFDRVF